MLRVIDDKLIDVWEDSNLLQVKDLFAKDLTEKEFMLFIELGKRTQLNPFLREIWAVKYSKTAAAQIFIGRDGYRKGAQRHPLYDYHLADAVYANDEFGVDNGRVMHRYKLKDRGELMGAYSVVKRKDSSLPSYVFVELKEYNLHRSVWNEKPATMIKKVAEAQCLRMAFQEFFAGTYSEAEQWKKPVNNRIAIIESKKPELTKLDVDDMDQMLIDISQVSTIGELKEIYTKHFRTCSQDKDPFWQQQIRIAKDTKKAELEQKEFVAEMDEENERQKNS